MSSDGRRRGKDRGFDRRGGRDFYGNEGDFYGDQNFAGGDRFGGGGDRFGGERGGYGDDRQGGGGYGGGRGGPQGSGESLGEASGTVKWFNPTKGFGFIARDEGDDVFVHISAVERAGHATLGEGQPVKFTLMDRGGRLSAADLQVEGEAPPPPAGSQRPQRDHSDIDFTPGEKIDGTVKFFNTMKGFGFIERGDGQQDAFVHVTALERSGIQSLAEGQRVRFELSRDRRGKVAADNIELI